MTMKELGRKKKYKKVKCSACGSNIDLIDECIEHINNVKFIICDKCGNEEILK